MQITSNFYIIMFIYLSIYAISASFFSSFCNQSTTEFVYRSLYNVQQEAAFKKKGMDFVLKLDFIIGSF